MDAALLRSSRGLREQWPSDPLLKEPLPTSNLESVLLQSISQQDVCQATSQLVSLSNEILEEILDELEPIDYYAMKIACRRMFLVRPDHRQSLENLKEKPWCSYLAKTWIEDPEAKELLCALCRESHPRKVFLNRDILLPGSVRTSWAEDMSIEMGQSKLFLTIVAEAIETRDEEYKIRHYSREAVCPSQSFIDGF